MAINAEKRHLWAGDTRASVELYNNWYMDFAPEVAKREWQRATAEVLSVLDRLDNLRGLRPEHILNDPSVLPVLRMCTAPPIAVDRLVGLSGASKSLVMSLEEGRLPDRMPRAQVRQHLDAVSATLGRMFDPGLFTWLASGNAPTAEERLRAAAVVADRLSSSRANPAIRNEQEARQLRVLSGWLEARGYRIQAHPAGTPVERMATGTYTFRLTVAAGPRHATVNIPVDCVIQPLNPRPSRLPVLVEAKSAGDFTNVNKRRKEEASKMHQLQERYGRDVEYILLLGGYFDSGYLAYEAEAGIDWVWEHRIDDFAQIGL
jgi:hypothetical protein